MVVQQIAEREDLKIIHSHIQILFAGQIGREEGALFDLVGADADGETMALPQLIDPRTYAPELLETDFYANATVLAQQLLGPEARLKGDHALVKPALHGAATPWHQDDAFRDGAYRHDEVSIWLALQDTDAINGCIAFVPGSHLKPILPHRSFNGDLSVHALECAGGWPEEDVRPCPMQAGDCSVHTNRTLHGAGPNMSDQPRYAYVLVFGAPPIKLPAPYRHEWLQNKREARLRRRRAWFLRGGLIVHGWRRLRQIPQIGLQEFVRRLRAGRTR